MSNTVADDLNSALDNIEHYCNLLRNLYYSRQSDKTCDVLEFNEEKKIINKALDDYYHAITEYLYQED